MTATWDRIRTRLHTEGRIDHHGNTRQTRARVCETCRAPVLTGFDGDIAALTVTVDPYPLSPLGEALAVLAGRPTFELRRTTRFELNTRDSFAITGTPAGGNRFDVVAGHRCWTPPLPTCASFFDTKRPIRPRTKDPPF